ncbi:unnamed protein product [Parajaminaea phylloscopi]
MADAPAQTNSSGSAGLPSNHGRDTSGAHQYAPPPSEPWPDSEALHRRNHGPSPTTSQAGPGVGRAAPHDSVPSLHHEPLSQSPGAAWSRSASGIPASAAPADRAAFGVTAADGPIALGGAEWYDWLPGQTSLDGPAHAGQQHNFWGHGILTSGTQDVAQSDPTALFAGAMTQQGLQDGQLLPPWSPSQSRQTAAGEHASCPGENDATDMSDAEKYMDIDWAALSLGTFSDRAWPTRPPASVPLGPIPLSHGPDLAHLLTQMRPGFASQHHGNPTFSPPASVASVDGQTGSAAVGEDQAAGVGSTASSHTRPSSRHRSASGKSVTPRQQHSHRFEQATDSRRPVDLASIRQVYSTSSTSRSRLSETAAKIDAAIAASNRRRAGTAASAARPSQYALRNASSMPEIEETGGPSAGPHAIARESSSHSHEGIRQPRRSQEDVDGTPASITAHFNSLGLDFDKLSELPEASATPGLVRKASATDDVNASFQLSMGSDVYDQSFNTSGSSALDMSSFEDSLLNNAAIERTRGSHNAYDRSGSQYTPLSSPSHSTQISLHPSSSDSILLTPRDRTDQHGYTCGPNVPTQAPTAVRKGVSLTSGILSQPTSEPDSMGATPLNAEMSGTSFVYRGPARHMRPLSTIQPSPPAQVHGSKSAGELSHAMAAPTLGMAEASSAGSAHTFKGRPISLDGSVLASRSRRSAGLASPDSRKGKRVDYSEVSAALETVRAFLRQRDGTSGRPSSGAASPQRATPDASINRTLRHTDGPLPPRGSVRLDGTAPPAGAGRGRYNSHSSHRHLRHLSYSIPSSDEYMRGQERLEALQHLSERVKALRQQSIQYSQLEEARIDEAEGKSVAYEHPRTVEVVAPSSGPSAVPSTMAMAGAQYEQPPQLGTNLISQHQQQHQHQHQHPQQQQQQEGQRQSYQHGSTLPSHAPSSSSSSSSLHRQQYQCQ